MKKSDCRTKYILRIFSVTAILFLCSLFIISCNKHDEAVSSESDISGSTSVIDSKEYTPSEFSLEADRLLSNSSKLTEIGDEYIELILELDISKCVDYCVKVQTSGTEADQYGIFVCSCTDDAETISEQLNAYLNTLRDSWDNFDYLPQEKPKIDAAEVKTNGAAVCYVIASESEKKAVFDLFSEFGIVSGRQ